MVMCMFCGSTSFTSAPVWIRRFCADVNLFKTVSFSMSKDRKLRMDSGILFPSGTFYIFLS